MVEGYRPAERQQAGSTYLPCLVPMRAALTQVMVEIVDIHPQIGTCSHTDRFPTNIQAITSESLIEGGKCTPQRPTSMRLVVFWPEQRCQDIAPMTLSRNHEIGNQRDRLTSIDFDRGAIALYTRRTEQVQGQSGHICLLHMSDNYTLLRPEAQRFGGEWWFRNNSVAEGFSMATFQSTAPFPKYSSHSSQALRRSSSPRMRPRPALSPVLRCRAHPACVRNRPPPVMARRPG